MSVLLKENSFNAERQVYEFAIFVPASGKVGIAQLRLIPSKAADMPEQFESHIYYEVEPRYRDKGYATDALRQLVKIAGSHGLKTLVVTVNADNLASLKVIEKCGGRLVAEGRTTDNTPVLKYQLSCR